jgi:hypothetical protein
MQVFRHEFSVAVLLYFEQNHDGLQSGDSEKREICRYIGNKYKYICIYGDIFVSLHQEKNINT